MSVRHAGAGVPVCLSIPVLYTDNRHDITCHTGWSQAAMGWSPPGRRYSVILIEIRASAESQPDLDHCRHQASDLQKLVQTAHAPVSKVVQAVPGVVGMKTFGATLSREAAFLRRSQKETLEKGAKLRNS